jgi:septal ring factor EnvC (AmiA/AmiB activator)
MLARIAVVASIVLPLAIAARPQPPAQKATPAEALRQRAAERIRVLQAEAASLASHEKTLLGELRRLEIERDLRTTELQRIEPEIAALEAQVLTTSTELDALEQKLRAQQPVLEAHLVDTYKLGRAGYVRLWFAVEDLRAFGRAYRLISALTRIDRDRLDDYRTTVDRLSATRADLDRRFSDLAMLRDEALSTRADMNDAVAAHVALIADIDRRRDLSAQLVGELREAQDRLEHVVSSLPPGGEPRPEGTEPLALPLAPFKGAIDWPVTGAVVTPFGPRVNPRLGTTTLSTGIEIAAAEGAAATAIHDGTVAFADTFAGFGLLVILDHGRQSHSLYGHLATIAVGPGAHVTKGQVVGTVGRGPLGRPSLYFELRVDGQPVDPVQWLKVK